MCSRRIEGLPNLPGNLYQDPTQNDFRKSQVFDYINGFRVPKDEYLGIGNVPITEKCTSVKDLFEIFSYDPSLTYGKPRDKPPPPCVPTFVALAKKVLRFGAYYKESVNDSPDEIYRVRPVEIFYYLEDDSIMVQEPKVENSGLMQGKFLRRHRVPKNDLGETYHWKDFNLRCEIMFYGRVFRVCDCDCFTKEFYESEGIIMNDPELIPKDPYTDRRFLSLQKRNNTSPDVCSSWRKKFLEYGNKALKFCCVWDDRESAFGGLRRMELAYYLADDTVEVREKQEPNCGRDPFTLLLHKIRLPKDWKDLPISFPVICLEPTAQEYVEYYTPKDFKIGATIMVFGRRFLIFNMDEFTKQWYRDNYGYTDFTPICVDIKKPSPPPICPPPWNGWGSPEDSLQSWLHIVPVRPRYDAIKSLIFELKTLKFGAVMDSTRPEDQGREFTISYRLSDDKMAVFEVPVRNSGWAGGKFLDFTRIIKPGSSNDCPDYYGPNDLYIGAMLDFYGHRFCLKTADPFVLEFITANPCCFAEHVKQNIRDYFECEKRHHPGAANQKPCDPGAAVCEKAIGEGFFEYLGLNTQKLDENPCAENPNPQPMPYDWDRCRTLGYNCGVQRPALGPRGMDPIDQVCESPCPGNPDAFEQKECAVCTPEKFLPPQPVMQSPLCEEPQCINPDEYYQLKEHRFDCYNPPTKAQAEEIHQKRLRFFCACPQGEVCSCGANRGQRADPPTSIPAASTCRACGT